MTDPPTRPELIAAGAASFRAAQLDTMPVIEQAKGILMAQQGCGPDEAFDLLRRASRRFNVPVRALAARLVRGVQRPGRQAAQVLHAALPDSRAVFTFVALLDEVLEFALTMLHAERGNVQLADPATGALRIAVTPARSPAATRLGPPGPGGVQGWRSRFRSRNRAGQQAPCAAWARGCCFGYNPRGRGGAPPAPAEPPNG